MPDASAAENAASSLPRLADAGGLSDAYKDGRAVAIVGGCVRRMQAVERRPSKLVRGEVHLFREPDADELTEAGRLRIDFPSQRGNLVGGGMMLRAATGRADGDKAVLIAELLDIC